MYGGFFGKDGDDNVRVVETECAHVIFGFFIENLGSSSANVRPRSYFVRQSSCSL